MARLPFRILAYLLLGGLIALAVQFYFSFGRIAHDKAINADVLQPLRDQPDVPLGQVVPPNNRWKSNAFVAERDTGGNAVLILDDHYRSGDPSYRSADGVIGDELSRSLLCSLRSQAKTKAVAIDPAVLRLIETKCGSGS